MKLLTSPHLVVRTISGTVLSYYLIEGPAIGATTFGIDALVVLVLRFVYCRSSRRNEWAFASIHSFC
jgi:hypothetical protein